MKIHTFTNNCSYDSPFSSKSGESEVIITFEFEKSISVQTRNSAFATLYTAIEQELTKFRWLMCGKIQIELSWLLNSVQRQETDKVGDLDNISKPLIDCLSGPNGLYIDDSQINSIHSSWTTKKILDQYSIVQIKISFFNDSTVKKENLRFLECDTAIYTPINFSLNNKQDLTTAKIFLKKLKEQRSLFNFDSIGETKRYLMSEYIFHRTRLSKFRNSDILTEEQLNKECPNIGVDYKMLD